MPVHTYRYGEAAGLPGLSIGVTRHAPRGVRREDRARRGYFQVWLPLLGPSPALLAAYRQQTLTFRQFAARYRREMQRREPRQVIGLLAALGATQPIHLGCFCADPATCHRTLLKELVDAAAPVADRLETRPYASPACAMPEIDD